MNGSAEGLAGRVVMGVEGGFEGEGWWLGWWGWEGAFEAGGLAVAAPEGFEFLVGGWGSQRDAGTEGEAMGDGVPGGALVGGENGPVEDVELLGEERGGEGEDAVLGGVPGDEVIAGFVGGWAGRVRARRARSRCG